MGQLDGRVGIITGAASGIGAATARVLAREGAKLLLTDLDDAAGLALAEAIGGTYVHHDVTDEAGWAGVIATVDKDFGRLDILVANAGIGIMGPVVDMSLADWRRQMAINVDGVFLSVKYCIPAMRRGGRGGSIVMLSSVAGLRGSAGLAGYSASKGAVRLFAKSMALECAQAGDGIRVTRCIPGSLRPRSGQSCRPERMCRSTRRRSVPQRCRSAKPARPRKSPTASCSWPRISRAT